MWNPWMKIKKWWCNITNRPFLDVNFRLKQDGTLDINAEYNGVFIYDLDRQYRDIEAFQNARTDDEKIAMMIYDIVFGIVQPILPPEEDQDPEEESPDEAYKDAPVMAFRGGVENRQIVDIADLTGQETDVRGVDVRG